MGNETFHNHRVSYNAQLTNLSGKSAFETVFQSVNYGLLVSVVRLHI